MQLHVDDMLSNVLVSPERNPNYRFMVAEWLWIQFGLDDLKTISHYNSIYKNFSDDGEILAGAYGPRLKNQWSYVCHNLKSDADTRQAVVSIWTPSPSPSKDIPCTIALQFLIRDNHLHLIATMRSSDVWLGLPYDFFAFTMLCNYVAAHFPEVELGSCTMQLGSSHLYDLNRDAANLVLPPNNMRSPRLPSGDEYDIRIHNGWTALKATLERPEFPWQNLPEPLETYKDILLGKREDAQRLLWRLHK